MSYVRISGKRRGRYWLKLVSFGLLSLLLTVWIGYDVMAVLAWTRPVPHAPCCMTPADGGFSFEEVAFRADGITLRGWYMPGRNDAAVILLHGYDSDRVQVLPQAMALAEAGYRVLLYDLRGHGESDPVLRSFGWEDVADVGRALSWLGSQEEVDTERIDIYGFSVGGQVAIRAAAAQSRLRAVVADGPALATAGDAPPLHTMSERVTNLGNAIVYQGIAWRTGVAQPAPIVDVIDSIAPRPLLLIGMGSERQIEQRIVRNYYAHAAEPKELWVIPDAGHGGGMNARPEAYGQRLIDFFGGALLGGDDGRG